MTAQEKFNQKISELQAQSLTSHDGTPLYASYSKGYVHILHIFDGSYYDYYRIDAPVASVEASVLKAIIEATNLDSDTCADEDTRLLLRAFATGDEEHCGDDDILNAIVWLWDNTPAFDDLWSDSGLFIHQTFEDDQDKVLLELCQTWTEYLQLSTDNDNVRYFLRSDGQLMYESEDEDLFESTVADLHHDILDSFNDNFFQRSSDWLIWEYLTCILGFNPDQPTPECQSVRRALERMLYLNLEDFIKDEFKTKYDTPSKQADYLLQSLS